MTNTFLTKRQREALTKKREKQIEKINRIERELSTIAKDLDDTAYRQHWVKFLDAGNNLQTIRLDLVEMNKELNAWSLTGLPVDELKEIRRKQRLEIELKKQHENQLELIETYEEQIKNLGHSKIRDMLLSMANKKLQSIKESLSELAGRKVKHTDDKDQRHNLERGIIKAQDEYGFIEEDM